RPFALRQPARLRTVQELHQRGSVPAAPRHADGARRDRAHPRRPQPRRQGRGRQARGGVSGAGRHVAVIGGGAAGTLQALPLKRAGAEVTLIGRGPVAGRGVAYGTQRPEHLLNVPARRMSALADDLGHFSRWFADRTGGTEEDYAPRMLYGDYLAGLLAEHGI